MDGSYDHGWVRESSQRSHKEIWKQIITHCDTRHSYCDLVLNITMSLKPLLATIAICQDGLYTTRNLPSFFVCECLKIKK